MTPHLQWAPRPLFPSPPLPLVCSPDYAQQFMDALPDAQLVWVDDCGHCAHLEQASVGGAWFVGVKMAGIHCEGVMNRCRHSRGQRRVRGLALLF